MPKHVALSLTHMSALLSGFESMLGCALFDIIRTISTSIFSLYLQLKILGITHCIRVAPLVSS